MQVRSSLRESIDQPIAATDVRRQNAAGNLTYLDQLESESIHVLREAAAEADNPVMLYSIGKDSSVLLHLALKAFYPAKPPFPLLHIDTTWKFRDMIAFRDARARELDIKLIVHVNRDGLARGINPITSGSKLHTDIMKTHSLRQALDHYGFDVALGGARRDEEKSRAKERVFSFRNAHHAWDPKRQRPEPWRVYNARKRRGESIRVFPLSNWTELDVWLYIQREHIAVVPLYFAAPRPVVVRDGELIMVDDERLPLAEGERPQTRMVRFRTLGCYPLTGAIESNARTVSDVIRETLESRYSERRGRVIDRDGAASMEQKKQQGYF
jgi:sulfate adenylyltransferase subunit 2